MAVATGWQASLALGFAARNGKTVFAHRRHNGPLAVQKLFYPEGSPCHCYILHPPGGVVGGDVLQITVDVAPDAHALITTPAAGKFYRSGGRRASLDQQLRVAGEAVLEWLPQETIFFDGSEVQSCTRIDLQRGAKLVAWEIVCLGRPASEAWFATGACTQRFELRRDGKPLLLERAHYVGGGEVLSARWGLAGRTVVGTMVATPADAHILEQVREIEQDMSTALFSASLMDDVLVCRFLGEQAEHARHCFTAAWERLRPHLLQRSAEAPRIWAT